MIYKDPAIYVENGCFEIVWKDANNRHNEASFWTDENGEVTAYSTNGYPHAHTPEEVLGAFKAVLRGLYEADEEEE